MSAGPILVGLLRAEIRRWQLLTDEIHELTGRRDAIREHAGHLLSEAGVATVPVDGYTVALVPAGVVRSVKAEKLEALGVARTIIQAATVETPRRGYVSILPPKGEDHG